jgi:hypothetical protein
MRDRTMRTVEVGAWPASGSPSPQRIRWGAVFAGMVLGLALLALLTTLWFALAFNSSVEQIRTNIEWYVGVSAVASLFVGGMLAGWLSGVRGAGSGLFNGFTVWALILIVALAIGIPAIFDVFNLGRVAAIADGSTFQTSGVNTTLWATFWTILAGFVASGLGGLIGGAVTLPANAQLDRMAVEHEADVDDEADEPTETREERYRAS